MAGPLNSEAVQVSCWWCWWWWRCVTHHYRQRHRTVLEAHQCCFFCQRLASLSCFISTPIQQIVWAYCVHNFRIWRSQCSVIIGWKSKNIFCYHLDINWHKEYYFFVLTGRVHSQLLASMSNWSRIIFTYFAPYPSPGENEMDICWRELRVTCE